MRGSVQSSLQSLHEAERVRRREISAHSPSFGADATSEWEAPFLSAQRGAGLEKPKYTAPGAPGQELRKQKTGETGGREERDEKANRKH